MQKIQFWYDLASPYSYLTAMRIELLASPYAVEVEWKPFLLGPIFAAQGWNTSPFNLYPAKGRYLIRDMERICADRDLPFKMPQPFPQNSLYAARLALIGEDEGWVAPFSRALFTLQFGEGASLTDKAVLAEALRKAGRALEAIMPRIEQPEIKEGLKARVTKAQALGIFGAPSFIIDTGDVFWGDDRLEQALLWKCRFSRPPGQFT